jgi:hypothetical protein
MSAGLARQRGLDQTQVENLTDAAHALCVRPYRSDDGQHFGSRELHGDGAVDSDLRGAVRLDWRHDQFKELVNGRRAVCRSLRAVRYASNPDFTYHSFRTTNVLRWEYRPGSALFVVWQGRELVRRSPTSSSGAISATCSACRPPTSSWSNSVVGLI